MDTAGGHDHELRTFDRSVTGQVSFVRDRTLISSPVKTDTITLDNSGPELRMIQFTTHPAGDSGTISDVRTMTPGVLFRTETMELGKTFGSDSVLDRSATGTGPDSIVYQTAQLIAVDQTVTLSTGIGPFTGCIKIARQRAARHLGSTYNRINTFCPGLGVVRQVQAILVTANAPVAKVLTQTWLKELETCDGSTGNCIQPSANANKKSPEISGLFLYLIHISLDAVVLVGFSLLA